MVNVPLSAGAAAASFREAVEHSGSRPWSDSGRRCCSSPPASTRTATTDGLLAAARAGLRVGHVPRPASRGRIRRRAHRLAAGAATISTCSALRRGRPRRARRLVSLAEEGDVPLRSIAPANIALRRSAAVRHLVPGAKPALTVSRTKRAGTRDAPERLRKEDSRMRKRARVGVPGCLDRAWRSRGLYRLLS